MYNFLYIFHYDKRMVYNHVDDFRISCFVWILAYCSYNVIKKPIFQ